MTVEFDAAIFLQFAASAVEGSESSWLPCPRCVKQGGYAGGWPIEGHEHGRPEQIAPPGDWRVWMLLAGRGFGKTRTAAEWVHATAMANPGSSGAIVPPTFAAGRDICVESGESGLLGVARARGVELRWNRANGELWWPNGSSAKIMAAETPERLRGPNLSWAWVDEPGSMAIRGEAAWQNLMLALRTRLSDGSQPRVVVSGTPRRVALVRRLVADAATKPGWIVTRGRTIDNAANLSPEALDSLLDAYAGTRLGRQELDGELLEDVDGALWQPGILEGTRVEQAPPLRRIVVAMDPAAKGTESADMMGIVAAGVGHDGQGFVLADRSMRGSPTEAVRRAAALFEELAADRVIIEANQGGDWLSTVWRQVAPSVPIKLVHATRGKQTRAEPVAALYEQGRVHHVGRELMALEDQMTTWVPGEPSPDRMDALVWALTELMVSGVPTVVEWGRREIRPVSIGR